MISGCHEQCNLKEDGPKGFGHAHINTEAIPPNLGLRVALRQELVRWSKGSKGLQVRSRILRGLARLRCRCAVLDDATCSSCVRHSTKNSRRAVVSDPIAVQQQRSQFNYAPSTRTLGPWAASTPKLISFVRNFQRHQLDFQQFISRPIANT